MKNNFTKFVIVSIILILLSEITKILLNFDNLIHVSLSKQFSTEQVEKYLEIQNNWKWLSYFFVPLYLFVKISIVSSILYIGVFFTNFKEYSFSNLFTIALNGEFIFLLVPILKIIWFYFFQSNYTLDDIQQFYPLSVINIIGQNGLESWLVYPLQSLNLFEVFYIIYLSYQTGYLTKTNADNGLKIIGYSYIPALLLWVTVVMFFTLNYS